MSNPQPNLQPVTLMSDGPAVDASAPPTPRPTYQPAPAPAIPPAVAPAVEYKGIGLRIVATIIDTIIYFIFSWVVAAQTGNTTSAGFEMTGAPAFLTFAVWLLYYILLEGFVGGTVGKLVLGMRIVNDRGKAPGIVAAIVRNLLRIVDFLPFAYILGMVLIATSKKKQRLGDRAAGTLVVASKSVKAMKSAAA
ncbi:MAG: RDD family protein [Chloroflexi bacterium]|nr:RDD family protein [Chloroflexota bacterium]